MDKKIERSNKEKVLRKLAKLIAPMGFVHSKTTFFTREVGPVVEFVHLHKFTFGPKFRAHLGIQVKNDSQVIALNGPESDDYPEFRSGRFSLEYQEAEVSLQTCADHIARYVQDIGEPWFLKWRNLDRLAKSSHSPLSKEARSTLARALSGTAGNGSIQTPRSLLKMMMDGLRLRPAENGTKTEKK